MINHRLLLSVNPWLQIVGFDDAFFILVYTAFSTVYAAVDQIMADMKNLEPQCRRL